MVEETFLDNMIKQQLEVINMNIDNVDIRSIIDHIIISKTRIEIFLKNLPLISCYYDNKLGRLQFDTLKD